MSQNIRIGARSIQAGDLLARASRAASGLHEFGIAENDSIALILRNCYEFLEASVAAGLVGAYPVPINWHFKAAEISHIIEDSRSKFIVVHSDLVARLDDALFDSTKVLVVRPGAELEEAFGLSRNEPMARDVEYWDDWLEGRPAFSAQPSMARGSMIYTSGTTGKPKGVKRPPMSAKQLRKLPELLHQIYGVSPDRETNALVPGPLYHTAPNGFALSILNCGGNLAIQTRFDAEEFLRLIESQRITHVQMVPIMFVRLLQLPKKTRLKYDVSSLTHVTHTGAPCPPEVKRRMIDWWGPVVFEFYGSTEGSALTLINSHDWLKHPGSVGRPISGVDIEIRAANGKRIKDGCVGEVFFRNSNFQNFSYHGREIRDQDVDDGFRTVGDMGRIDEGFLYLADRRTDMIISGGVNIYPAEIESEIFSFDEVSDCAVFGIDDPEYGQSVAACVQLEAGYKLTATEIRGRVADSLASFKVPKSIAFVETLPREDSGKIFKRQIVEDCESGRLHFE